ncbi:N-acetylmuramoyl-L-alanine amidase [Deinococcus peraridilitoris]|uniref:N-acetylmuramoyl-L-alanine amidase n=1 Tax=Deinococcus peraridilitoris (strain DSM 19664 / LMG 22246 / CIP 109416 / KR-200) TaxID=937777 RepID=K9ZZM7_DEIPD|nr:peptidoglycan recognition family protein [Deinococcus peraridilitoris]AFZ67056.1 negative regulator of beta-lactamase expression [Deinococcus peraridilitoris DSM 19664]
MSIEQRPAHGGNYARGRGVPIDRVVIHVADGSYDGTLSWFANPDCNVSAHYTVAMNGRVGQSVREDDTAWHAGDTLMNRRSIGIEHEGRPSVEPWTPSDAQLRASASLVAGLCLRYGIPADRTHLIGHNEVNPKRTARKNCPGPTWPWERYVTLVRSALVLIQPPPLDALAEVFFEEPGGGEVRMTGEVTRYGGLTVTRRDDGTVLVSGKK